MAPTYAQVGSWYEPTHEYGMYFWYLVDGACGSFVTIQIKHILLQKHVSESHKFAFCEIRELDDVMHVIFDKQWRCFTEQSKNS